MNPLSISTIFLSLAALLAGAVVPLQAASNGALARQLGHPLWASMLSLLVSMVVVLPLLYWFKVPKPSITPSLLSQPWWIWLGGVAGIIYITAALILVPQMGGTSFFVLVIAGQLMISAILDHFGWMGMPKQLFTWHRLLGIALVLMGVLFIQFWPKAP